MNQNSLIIAADASRARLFRTAHPNVDQTSLELLEVEAIDRAGHDEELRAFARQIAERAAHFAQYHLCNPIIVSATHAVSPLLSVELEQELPHVYVRSVSGEMASLPAPELLDALCKREAFTPVQYPPHS
jgi:hypothetical protein